MTRSWRIGIGAIVQIINILYTKLKLKLEAQGKNGESIFEGGSIKIFLHPRLYNSPFLGILASKG